MNFSELLKQLEEHHKQEIQQWQDQYEKLEKKCVQLEKALKDHSISFHDSSTKENQIEMVKSKPSLPEAKETKTSLLPWSTKKETKMKKPKARDLPKHPQLLPYKYLEVIRNKKDREALPATDCTCCRSFYTATYDHSELHEDLEQLKRDHLQTISRHRHVYLPPVTPPHYWDVGFPEGEEENPSEETSRPQCNTNPTL